MPDYTIQADRSAFVRLQSPNTNFSSGTKENLQDKADGLLVHFAAMATAGQFKKIRQLQLFVGTDAPNDAYGFYGYALKTDFSEKSATYNSQPERFGHQFFYTNSFKDNYARSPYISSNFERDGLKSIFSHGMNICIDALTGKQTNVYTSRSSYPPYIVVTVYDEVIGLSISGQSPAAGGFVDRTKAATFTWASAASGWCYGDVTETTCTLQWRDGTTGTVHTVAATPQTGQCIIPANTFPSSNQIQWRVSVVSNSGVTTTSDWITISTKDSTPTATPLEPIDVVVDASRSVSFSWQHSVATGTAQTKADLEISSDKETWSSLVTVTGALTSYTAPANTLGSGTKYWRVRTYNTDGTAGSWSDAAQFIAIGAPAAPSVTVLSANPRPEIRWQSDEQQAYQVEIDGVYASGTRFGTGKTWKAPFYLADGNYTVRVRVQNEYGFWSPWGTAALPVTNVPGGAITLTAEGGIEAALSWTPGSFDYYLVYRDGVAIAKVTEPSYTDAASIGGVRYQVRGCYDNSDNYSLSEAVEVTVSTDNVRLYDMERGEWLHFLYDSSAHRSTGLSLSQDIQYVQLSGHTYPVAERSEFKSRALRITCVCADDAERQSLRALLGHLTCCKTPEGNMTIGYPASITENSDDFFSTYSFTIEQIDRKEEINIDS
jgi:hypothetical protein